MNIKTWRERKAWSNQQWPDEECMQAEIDELRAYLATLKDAHELVAAAMAVMAHEANALKQQEPVGHLALDGDFIQNQRYVMEFGIVPRGKPLYLEAGAQAVPAGYQLVPIEPTTAMVSAYLEANKSYWERTDELPKPPHKWRLGTPFDATIDSYKAMLAAAKEQP